MEQVKKVRFDESKNTELVDEHTFMVDMINNYINHYKKINNKPANFTLFDGINFDDLSSTNAPLEIFYEEMLKYKVNEKSNPNFIKIYNETERNSMQIIDEMYGILDDGKPVCFSTSFFSLLIEMTNLKNENPNVNYSIVSLK